MHTTMYKIDNQQGPTGSCIAQGKILNIFLITYKSKNLKKNLCFQAGEDSFESLGLQGDQASQS